MTQNKNFYIKSGYEHKKTSTYFEDVIVDQENITHQPDVYVFASLLAKKFGCTHILDIGCGHGIKLSQLNTEFTVTGIDIGSNIEYCTKQYAFGQWLCLDLEYLHEDLLPIETLQKTLVVCSDVIEHLVDPSGLLLTLQNCLKHAPVAILTTPERDLVRGFDDIGPPANPAHVREWNQYELNQLLHAFAFDVAFLGLTYNNDRDWEKKTILSVLHGTTLQRQIVEPLEAFRVIAFITAYNEQDIIYHSIRRVIDSGVDVYLIDNWSTDKTVEIAATLLGRGLISIERFPAKSSTGTYDWYPLLKRIESLAQSLKADWFIHHDADEIRESPWPDLKLKEALRYVDQMGFNAIDHTVIDFRPIDNNFVSGADFGIYFTHWEFGRRPGHFQQIKAWKNLGQSVTLADTGGHNVDFSGRRVCPYKFLLRHYPVRSQEHGERKILAERKPRFNLGERKLLGWHTQYDRVENGHDFLCKVDSLSLFVPDRFYKEFLLEIISGIGILRSHSNEPVTRIGLEPKGIVASLFINLWTWITKVRPL